MTVSCNESAKAITITLSGSVMLDETVNLILVMLDSLESDIPRINLNLTSITEADETFFKMLLVLNRMLSKQKKILSLTTMSDDHCIMIAAANLGLNLKKLIKMEDAP